MARDQTSKLALGVPGQVDGRATLQTDRGDETQALDTLQGQESELRAKLAREREKAFEDRSNLEDLEKLFLDCLVRSSFPGLDASYKVTIDPKTLVPEVAPTHAADYIVPLLFVIGAAVGALAQIRRQGLLLKVAESASPTALGEMSWRDFEGLIEEAFRIRGYSVRRLGGDRPDGGVDLVLDRGAEKVLVQCKQWRAFRVGVTVVRELYGVMAAQGAAAGIVVTSGSFTPDAIEFASGRNVRLIAGPELHTMIQQAKASLAPARAGAKPQTSASAGALCCPKCGSAMVRREAKRGANAGRAFYGCSRFPDCRVVVAID
jgi:restriction system protein